MNLLPQLGLSLLDGGHDHIADARGGQTVQPGADALDGDNVEVPGARVVGAVYDGTAVCRLVLRRGGRIQGPVYTAVTYTGRPRVILSLPPGAPRLFVLVSWVTRELLSGHTPQPSAGQRNGRQNIRGSKDACVSSISHAATLGRPLAAAVAPRRLRGIQRPPFLLFPTGPGRRSGHYRLFLLLHVSMDAISREEKGGYFRGGTYASFAIATDFVDR